jgi:hypothetical protein
MFVVLKLFNSGIFTMDEKITNRLRCVRPPWQDFVIIVSDIQYKLVMRINVQISHSEICCCA